MPELKLVRFVTLEAASYHLKTSSVRLPVGPVGLFNLNEVFRFGNFCWFKRTESISSYCW